MFYLKGQFDLSLATTKKSKENKREKHGEAKQKGLEDLEENDTLDFAKKTIRTNRREPQKVKQPSNKSTKSKKVKNPSRVQFSTPFGGVKNHRRSQKLWPFIHCSLAHIRLVIEESNYLPTIFTGSLHSEEVKKYRQFTRT